MWKTKCQETTDKTFYCELIFSFTLTGSPAANLELFRRLSRTKHRAKFLQPSCLRFPCGHNYNLLFGPSTLFPALFEEFHPALIFLGKTDLSQALEQERDVCLRDLKNKTGFLWKKQLGKFNQSMSGAFLFTQNTFFLFH